MTGTGGVAGPTAGIYICPNCIDLTYEIVHHGDEIVHHGDEIVQICFTAPRPTESGPTESGTDD
jgi:hypothetical protein